MNNKFYTLPIKNISKETADCISVSFDIKDELKTIFTFVQGQYLTLKTIIDGVDVRRNYSLCSSPLENEWRIAIKKVNHGVFSNYAHEYFKVGDEVEVMPPLGNFYVSLTSTEKKNYVAFAVGSGITPIISIIKTTLAAEPLSQFTLIYANKNRESIIFLEELEALKNIFVNRFILLHILSREKIELPIYFGRIDTEKLNQLAGIIDYKNIDDYFICGPQEMIQSTKDFLINNQINEKKIHIELFHARNIVNKISEIEVHKLQKFDSKIQLKLDGRYFNFNMPFQQNISILEAAIQQNADVPFACKGGMCATCKCKLVNGKVDMQVHWGLDDDERENGFILACQSYPLSDLVEIDFDIK